MSKIKLSKKVSKARSWVGRVGEVPNGAGSGGWDKWGRSREGMDEGLCVR